MSLRYEDSSLPVDRTRVGVTAVASTGMMAPTTMPQTISQRLGIAPNPPPSKRLEPFQPQYKEVPEVSESVVEDMFEGYDADPTGLFGKKKNAAGAKVEPKKGFLAKAKAKANAAVRKGVAGAKSLAKGTTDLVSGLSHFDFKLYSDTFTAMLAVAKKVNGTNPDDKNNYQAFAGDSRYKAIAKGKARAQEDKMTRTESQAKNVKGRESKTISRKIKGRNAACLGFAQVTKSEDSEAQFGDLIYPPAQAAGIPTLVTLTAKDTNGEQDMRPITGLVVEAIDVDKLEANQGGRIAVNFVEVKDAGAPAESESMDTDAFEFKYNLCVHGLHVDEDKGIHVGPKILVPIDNIDDVSAYGIDTEDGVESALAHALLGQKLDLLLLWTSFKLVQGAKGLANGGVLNPAQKKAAQELFGSLDGVSTQNTISEDVEGDEFDELNHEPIYID